MHRHRGASGSFSKSAARVHPMNVLPPVERGGIRL